MDKDEHARVENTVFVGVWWKWSVDTLELEIESGAEQRSELLSEGNASCAETNRLREKCDDQRDQSPEEIEE